MDEENNLMEETQVTEDCSDTEFACGDPQVEPRVGDEFQVEIPPMMSAIKRALFLSTPVALDDSSNPFLIGLPVQVMWIDKHRNGDGDDNVDMNQSLRSLKSKRSRCCAKNSEDLEFKKPKLNLEAVPAILPSSSWEDFEVASFVLALYTFGKNYNEVKKFMESKAIGEILLFYYSKFYKSAKYHSWSDSRKKRNRKCVYGRKLYSGWRQQLLLSRLIPSIPDESQKQKLVNVSKSFAEGNNTLEEYVSAVKDLVGLRLLVDAVGIGKEKEDLTVLTAAPIKTKPWFTVSPKPSSVPPGLRAYNSLTSVDIINELTGPSRLSKARCNDIFWEAVWPRLLARGWHSEQPKDRGYFTTKDYIVFIVPGVKTFSREKLVKGDDYFDSVSDILTKVASEPELLEFETGGEIREEAENSSDQSDQTIQRKSYLRSPCSSNHGTHRMKFTVVDTSLAAGGKLCDLRNLNAESLVIEQKTGRGNKDSCVLEEKRSQRMPLDAKKQVDDDPMRFTIIDTSLERRGFRRLRHLPLTSDDSSIKEEEEKTLEKVKDPSKRLIKHRFTGREESNYHSVSSAPLLKRRRLSACVRSEKSRSRKSPPGDDTKTMVCPESDHLSLCGAVQHQNSVCEKTNEEKERYETVLVVDQSKKTGIGPSSSLVEIQETSEIEQGGLNSISGLDKLCSPEEVKSDHELNSAEQEPNGICSVSDSDKRHASNDLEQEQSVKVPSISGSNTTGSPSKDVGVAEQQQHKQQINADGPRRLSTRKRPLTTRALEALESGFFTTKRMKSTRKPESCRKKKLSAKARNNRTQLLSDNRSAADLETRSISTASKPLVQREDSKPSFLLNEAKALDRIQDPKPATEYPKLPPIVLKLSLKRR